MILVVGIIRKISTLTLIQDSIGISRMKEIENGMDNIEDGTIRMRFHIQKKHYWEYFLFGENPEKRHETEC